MSDSRFKVTRREAIGLMGTGLAVAAVAGTVPALAADGEDIQVSLTINETETLESGDVLRLHIGADSLSRVSYAALWADVKFGDKDGYLVGTEEIELLGYLPAYGRRSYVVDVPMPKDGGAKVVLKGPQKAEEARFCVAFDSPGLSFAVSENTGYSMRLVVENLSEDNVYTGAALVIKLMDEDDFTLDLYESHVDFDNQAHLAPGETCRASFKYDLAGDGWITFADVPAVEGWARSASLDTSDMLLEGMDYDEEAGLYSASITLDGDHRFVYSKMDLELAIVGGDEQELHDRFYVPLDMGGQLLSSHGSVQAPLPRRSKASRVF